MTMVLVQNCAYSYVDGRGVKPGNGAGLWGEGGGRMTNGFVTHPHTLAVSSLNTNFKEKVAKSKRRKNVLRHCPKNNTVNGIFILFLEHSFLLRGLT